MKIDLAAFELCEQTDRLTCSSQYFVPFLGCGVCGLMVKSLACDL